MKGRSWLLALALVACGRSSESIEAERMVHAIDALRSAPAEQLEGRKHLLDALRGEPAKTEVAVRARDACVKAYDLMITGTALEASVREAMHTGKATPATMQDLLQADTKLKEASLAMPACEEGSATLRRIAH